jgi:hypothetical protein
MPEFDRSKIRKGMFLTSTPSPETYLPVQRQPLPDDRTERDAAAKLSQFDRQHAAAIDELARRLRAVKAGLDEAAAKAKRK